MAEELADRMNGMNLGEIKTLNSFHVKQFSGFHRWYTYMGDLRFFVSDHGASSIAYVLDFKSGECVQYNDCVVKHAMVGENLCVHIVTDKGDIAILHDQQMKIVGVHYVDGTQEIVLSNNEAYVIENDKVYALNSTTCLGKAKYYCKGIANGYSVEHHKNWITRHMQTSKEMFALDCGLVYFCGDFIVYCFMFATMIFDTLHVKMHELTYRTSEAIKIDAGVVLSCQDYMLLWTPQSQRKLDIIANGLCHITKNVIGCEFVDQTFHIIEILF